jgi:hypothetical protein
VSINAQELDAEARRVRQIADELIQPDEEVTQGTSNAIVMAHSRG